MSGYLLFLPDDFDGRPKGEQAFATEEVVESVVEQAVANAIQVGVMSERAGVSRVAASVEVYLENTSPIAVAESFGDDDKIRSAHGDDADVQIFGAFGAVAVETLDRNEVRRLRNAGFVVARNRRTYVGPTRRIAAGSDDFWHLEASGARTMHQRGATGKNVRIGILDTGIDADHPEFAGKSIVFAEFDRLGRMISTTPRDSGDHGTHVSAIAAGLNAGVAKDADLAVAAVLTEVGETVNRGFLAQIIGGLEWMLGLGAADSNVSPVSVVNASLGGRGYNDYLLRTVRRAEQLGVPFVASIGNSGRQGVNSHGSPGNYDTSIGVGAINMANDVANFSAWGSVAQHGNLAKPDLCAPGVAIRAAVPGGGYDVMSGTSMAAPCVAGAVALLIDQNRALDGDVVAIKSALYARVVDLSQKQAGRGGRGRLAL